jgi:sugar/nucleoside kinase (ribokinase family)
VLAAAAAGGTRTCIHTPGAALKPEELHSDLIRAALQDAALVYFDGRLTEAAILLARAARAAGVPVLVEGERLRPGLQDLLAEADYIVTSAHFPQVRNSHGWLPASCGSCASALTCLFKQHALCSDIMSCCRANKPRWATHMADYQRVAAALNHH